MKFNQKTNKMKKLESFENEKFELSDNEKKAIVGGWSFGNSGYSTTTTNDCEVSCTPDFVATDVCWIW